MGSEGNGNGNCLPTVVGKSVFALVIYIPDPLGAFLDDLRRELVPAYKPRAHVSVLPPRTLEEDWDAASDQLRLVAEAWAPFDIELTEVGVFPVTDVIYLNLGAGGDDMRRMHTAMNTQALAFHEPFDYHPHVTLAQEIPPSNVETLARQAQRRWEEYKGPRRFRATRAAFVRNTSDNCWIDLAEYCLGSIVLPRR